MHLLLLSSLVVASPSARLTQILFAEELSKTKVTGIEPVNKLQDGINDTGEGIGNMASKEGVNRAETGGKEEQEQVSGMAAGAQSTANAASGAGGAVSSGLSGVTGALAGGGK